MKLDDLLRVIGEFGPYQKRVYFLAALPTVLGAAEALGVIFIFFIPKHRCAIPGFDNDTYAINNAAQEALRNLTIPFTDGAWETCYVYTNVSDIDDVRDTNDVDRWDKSTCSRWVYDQSTFRSTLATDFDVVCDRSILRAQSTIIAELGAFIGMFICGLLADRFGRKLVFFLSAIMLFVGGLGIAFTKTLAAVNVCRFILGTAKQSVLINGLVLGMEMVGPSKRTFAGMGLQIAWCLGGFYLCIFAYFIRTWRYLEIAISVPGIFFVLLWWLLPESPRWLISQGQEVKAMAILKKVADSNKTSLPIVDDATQLLDKEEQLPFWHIFRSRELMKRAVIVCLNLFVNILVYYGTTLNITNLSGDIFINFTIGFVLEGLAYAVCLFLLGRVGRKVLYVTCILAGGACCIFSILPVMLKAPSWIVVGLSMTGRFFIMISLAVVYLYSAELFPTVVRSSAVGACSSFSRIANFVSPYLADLGLLVGGKFRDALPLVVMGSPAILIGLMALYLPETRNTTLPETLEDLEKSERQTSSSKPDVNGDNGVSDPTKNGIGKDDNCIQTSAF